MPLKDYQRTPKPVNGWELTGDINDLVECAKWCSGELALSFEDGAPDASSTSIMFTNPGGYETARIGDVIYRYWNVDGAPDAVSFWLAPNDEFFKEYQLR